MILIKVKKADGLPGTHNIYLEYFDTIQTMKETIHLHKDIRVPPSQQQIFINEQHLEDHHTVSQCGLQEGSWVELRGN